MSGSGTGFVTMRDLAYAAPRDLAGARALLAGDGALALGGGQALLPLLRRRALAPRLLVDLKRIPELRRIEADGELRIGGAVTLDELARSPAVRAHAPLLADVAAQVGSFHVRNRATIGGALARLDRGFDLHVALRALGARWDGPLVTEVTVPPTGSTRTGFASYRRRGGEFPLVSAAAVVRDGAGPEIVVETARDARAGGEWLARLAEVVARRALERAR